MPAAGNHEIEKANGPLGLGAYQTYFTLPSTETDAELAGLWYAFTVGSVRVIVLQNDDNCLQDGGDVYISGYSGGRQLAFLEKELKAARSSGDVDWVVVAMHQVMISSSDANGADLGLRQKYGPCSTVTVWTWSCAAMSTTTSARSPFAASSPAARR